MPYYVGTSGYQYDFWKGSFYPKDLPKKDYLKYYATKFDVVEINNTYYKFPTKSVVKQWFDSTPADFKFIVKMNIYVTTYKKLSNVGGLIRQFVNVVKNLKHKLLCVLFQFPSNFSCTEENFNRVKKIKRSDVKYAFEFRHSSWFNNTVYDMLEDNGWILVISNYSKGWNHLQVGFNPSLSPDVITNRSVLYFRLHGPSGKYEGSYSKSVLDKMVKFIKSQRVKGAYVLFNNTDSVHQLPDAVKDALRVQKML